MRSIRLVAVAVLAVILALSSMQSAFAATPEQPLAGFAWWLREIPVVIQQSPEYAHDAVLEAMETWNLAQTWFSDTYHVQSRPYTFVEVQELGESYVKVTFNETQTTEDWSTTSRNYWWDNNGRFYKVRASTSIDLRVQEGQLSPPQLRSLATSAMGFALGLDNTVFSKMDLLNWYSVDHNVVVPSTLNLHALALLSMVTTRYDMPESPVTLPPEIPYETPAESAIPETQLPAITMVLVLVTAAFLVNRVTAAAPWKKPDTN